MNDLYDHVPIEILPLYSDPSLSQCVECNSINFPNHVLYDLVTDSQVMLSNDWHTASFSCVKHKITHGLWLTPPYMQDDKSDAPLPIHYDFHFTMCMISLPSTVQLFLHYMTQQTSLSMLYAPHTTWDHLHVTDQTLHNLVTLIFFPVYCAISII